VLEAMERAKMTEDKMINAQERITIIQYRKFLKLLPLMILIQIGLIKLVWSFPEFFITTWLVTLILFLLPVYLFLLIIAVFINLYEVCKILKKVGKIKTNPLLILNLAIVGIVFPIITIVIFIIIWEKLPIVSKI